MNMVGELGGGGNIEGNNSFLNINVFYIHELQAYTLDRCPVKENNAWIRMLILMHFLPLFISTGYYIVSPLRKELYIAYVGMGILVDKLLNLALINIFRVPLSNPGCGPNDFNMPDSGVQQFTFVYTMIISYYTINDVPLGFYERVVMTIMTSILPVANVRLGYATLNEVMVGSFVGVIEAIIWQVIASKLL